MADFLIFIDTNILLDFYRVRGREAGLSILSHVDQNLNRFITTSQVEMEFKKHRQRVILESHGAFKAPDWGGLQLPAFLSESKQSKALARNQKQVKDLSTTLKGRMTRILHNPTTEDDVYRTVQRLFRSDSNWNLGRDKKKRFAVRRLAWKRFMLGYPPRKDHDVSLGDALNWEWVVDCAIESGCHAVIVSRDSDYGVTFGGQPVINDWLLQEFRERVSKRRKLLLTDRLSAALKAAQITVSKQEVESEEEFLKDRPTSPMVASQSLFGNTDLAISETFRRLLNEQVSQATFQTDPVVTSIMDHLRQKASRPKTDAPDEGT